MIGMQLLTSSARLAGLSWWARESALFAFSTEAKKLKDVFENFCDTKDCKILKCSFNI
jgi:hypothetical protein